MKIPSLFAAAFAVSMLAVNTAAFADDSCSAKVEAAKAQAATITDASKKKKYEALLAKADEEANAEMDENECLKVLAEAEKLLK